MLLSILLAPTAPANSAGALVLPGQNPLVRTELAETTFEMDYEPPVNSEYAVYLLSADGGKVWGQAELLLNGELIASGEGSGALCSARLVAGAHYTLQLRGSGSAIVEFARNALSRCADNPLTLEENVPAGKMIARAYDAHWYSFEAAASGRLMLTCMPEEADLELCALLFDESGALISEFEPLSGGACMLLADTQAGRRYLLRVCANGDQTGYYTLNLHRSTEGTISNALQFNDNRPQALAAGSILRLSPLLSGEALLWVSDTPEIAAVDQEGTVIGLAPGRATITAYGMSSQAACIVEIVDVPLEGLSILNPRMELCVGDEVQLALAFTPQNASDRRVSYEIADPKIASVSEFGVITALAPGETALRVTDTSGRFSAVATVAVEPAGSKYRALLVGEQNYPFGANAVRNGSENSVAAIEALLKSGRFTSTEYIVQSCSDLSRAELIAELRSTFGSASAQDISLLYITCHGSFTGGMSFLELSDGSELSARDLEKELRRIPGTIIVLIDCCGSGGAIGAASERLAFARGITGAFSGATICGSKYKVIASAGLDEDSYRLAFNQDATAGVMTTVFARAFCDGAGWDIDRGSRGTMGADADYDGEITLNELVDYMSARVAWYMTLASELTGETYRQSVQVYPEGDPFTLFQ